MAFGVKERVKEGQKIPTRTRSSAQEKTVAKAVNGQTTPNSGATAFQKGDILTSGDEAWLIECKTKMTHSESISIKKEWFDKNKEEMIFMGKKHQAVVFSFGPGEENHYIIDEYLFQELLEYLKKKFNFESEAHQKNHSVGIKIDKKPDKKKQAYAGLFDED